MGQQIILKSRFATTYFIQEEQNMEMFYGCLTSVETFSDTQRVVFRHFRIHE